MAAKIVQMLVQLTYPEAADPKVLRAELLDRLEKALLPLQEVGVYLTGQLIKMDVRDAEPGESAGIVARSGVDDDEPGS